jgi:hypothetical protein
MAEYQPLDDDLTSLAAASAENAMYYRSGRGAWVPLALGGGLIFDTGTLSAPGGGATEYGFEASTTAPPNARRIRFNNASATNTTALYIDNTTAGRNNIRLILLDLPINVMLYLQDKNTSGNFVKFLVTAPTIDRGSYIEVPVVAIANGGAIPNDGRVLLYVSGSGRGVTNGSDAAAGQVGEYRSASNTAGSALVTGVSLNVATLALSAGDWDVWGQTIFAEAANTDPSVLATATSPVSATMPTPAQLAAGQGAMTQIIATFTSPKVIVNQVMQTGPDRYNSNAAQTIYLVAQASFSGGTLTVTGFISARRIR